MALLGLTAAQAKLAKWVVRAASQAIPAGLAWLADDLVSNPEAPSTLEWRRFVYQWSRATPAGTTEDIAQFKLDLLNVTADELDVTWTSGDYSTVAGAALTTFKNSLLPFMSPSQTWSSVKAYRMRFNATPDITRPFADSGPPTYVAAMASSGTGTGAMPYQVAPTVTMRTSWNKHWGRIYLPTPGTASIDTSGRLTSTYRSGVSAALSTYLGTLHDAGFYPVIPVGQLNKLPFHGLLGVTTVITDDVPDVQRRRRARIVAARS